MNKVHYSSQITDWETPQHFFDELNQEFDFDCDACATEKNKKCPIFFEDALSDINWANYDTIFMNPPYGRSIGKFIAKANYQSKTGKRTVVCLLPARTDTRWFHDYILGKAEIRFLKGRLKFEIHGKPILDKKGKPSSAPFPSMIAIYKPQEAE